MLLSILGLYMTYYNALINETLHNVSFRSPKLHTASNRLLISLLGADIIILTCCYVAAIQGLAGSPIFGALGKRSMGFFLMLLNVILFEVKYKF